jgi:hypothetical protein
MQKRAQIDDNDGAQHSDQSGKTKALRNMFQVLYFIKDKASIFPLSKFKHLVPLSRSLNAYH